MALELPLSLNLSQPLARERGDGSEIVVRVPLVGEAAHVVRGGELELYRFYRLLP
jgi:hypothetical protein